MSNRYDRTAEAILAKTRAAKAPTEPTSYVEPIPEPLPKNLSGAYARGYSDASDVAGACCGCNTYPSGITNPYDGSPL